MKKRIKEKPKKDQTEDRRHKRIASQLWGIFYSALSFLLLVGLISQGLQIGDSNILGPHLGSAVAVGLRALFGSIIIFILPFTLLYVGVQIFREGKISIGKLFLILLFSLQVILLSFVHRMPDYVANNRLKCRDCGAISAQVAGSFDKDRLTFLNNDECTNCAGSDIIRYYNIDGNNFVGYLGGRFILFPLFGSRTFAPTFILSLSIFMTVIWFFRIDLLNIWGALSQRMPKGGSLKINFDFKRLIPKLPQKKAGRSTVEEEITIVPFKEEPVEPKILITKPSYTEAPVRETPPNETPAKDSSSIDDEPSFEPEIVIHRTESPQPSQESYEEEDDIDSYPTDPTIFDESDEEFENLNYSAPKKYELPSFGSIADPPPSTDGVDEHWIKEKSQQLTRTLEEFRIRGCKVVAVSPGPVVSRFEIELAPGIPVKKILNLQDDIALKVGGKSIRIQAPIPGKAAIGIEIPNDNRQTVFFKEILNSPAFTGSSAALPVIIGKSISGAPLVEDISKMPHLLIAGQTGAGKSVGINSFIASLLFSKKPDELRLILIDPKKVEMSCYEGIPHLLSPVVIEPEKAVAALQWGVKEMERRYRLLAKVGSKNLSSFNGKVDSGALDKFVDSGVISLNESVKLPYIVIVVDELADLMMTASKDVEKLVQRIAQLARAVGIHLIVATQRPSVDIITGPIKANLTSRISFRTIQSQDSRTILGSIGAEKLLGNGDMLYLKNGAPSIERYHGAFISEDDVENLADEIRSQGVKMDQLEFHVESNESYSDGDEDSGERDEFFEEAARIVVSTGLGSTSMIQRRLSVGYSRAGRIMDQLQRAGIVGEPQGSKPREVLATADQLDDMF